MRRTILFCLTTIALLAGFLLVATPSQTIAGDVNLSSAGVAIDGHDPVAYFTVNKAVRGSAEFSTRHDGATYHFASAENKATFSADPERYLPQYGGFCAYGAAQGYKAPVEVDKFTIVSGKLYLNYDARVQSTWLKDTEGYITKGDDWWMAN